MAFSVLLVSLCALGSRAAEVDMDLDLQMAWMATWPIGGMERKSGDDTRAPEPGRSYWSRLFWLTQKSANSWGDADKYTLSKTTLGDKKCLVAMAGTESPGDMVENADIRKTTYCGFTGVHAGVVRELQGLLDHEEYRKNWLPVLTGPECSGGVYAVGHSLGGAQASVYAACANNGSKPYGFEVAGLYTFGAFAPSNPPLVNKVNGTYGCFPGARYYNQDSGDYDLIPGLTTNLGFRHPQVAAKTLSRRYAWVRGAELEVWEYPCESKCAALYPTDDGYFSVPTIIDHNMDTAYLSRMIDLLDTASNVTSKVHEGKCTLGTNQFAADIGLNESSAACAQGGGGFLGLLVVGYLASTRPLV